MCPAKTKTPSFEDAFRELEAVVAALEKGDTTLEEALTLFEKGMALAQLCSSKLNEAEKRLQRLVKNEKGDFQLEMME